MPDLFNRFEEHYKISNESVTVCQITSGSKNYSYRLTASEEENLTDFLSDDIGIGSGMNPSVFINTFIIGTACLVANIVSAALAKKVGLKLLTGKCSFKP